MTLRIATRVKETEVWFEDKKTRGEDGGSKVVNTLHMQNISTLALLQCVCSYIDVRICVKSANLAFSSFLHTRHNFFFH